MSTNDEVLQEFQRLRLGHVQNLQDGLEKLISKLCFAKAQNNTEFPAQIERTRNAVFSFQRFYGQKNRPRILDEVESWITRLENGPTDYAIIRELVKAQQQVALLASGVEEGTILEDQFKNLVTDQKLTEELDALETKLREFIEERGNEISFNALREIQRLADLIRQSQKRSILETIFKMDALYATIAAIADTYAHGGGTYTALTGLCILVSKVNGIAKNSVKEKYLGYIDDLEIQMAGFKSKLPSGGNFLAIENAESREPDRA